MTAFSAYAQYYDLLYRDKDYGEETRFVIRQLESIGGFPTKILELGCGTGRHAAEMARRGISVTGIDLSSSMISLARAEALRSRSVNISFEVGDIRTYRNGSTFDAVISLFHVISYQTSDADLRHALATASHHLLEGGMFFFDFWFGPAVIADPPEKRLKTIKDTRIHVRRVAVPRHDQSAETVTVTYEIEIEDRETGSIERVNEDHTLRYFFPKHLDQMLTESGFALEKTGAWMTDELPSEKSWYAWAIYRKL